MKVKVTKGKRQKKRVKYLLDCHGTSGDKQAYKSITNNILGLTRKVQSLQHKLINAKNYIGVIESELAEERKQRLFGDARPADSLAVGSGEDHLLVYGDPVAVNEVRRVYIVRQESEKVIQRVAALIQTSRHDDGCDHQQLLTRIERDLVRILEADNG